MKKKKPDPPRCKSLLWRIARTAELEAVKLALATHETRAQAAQSLGISTVTLRTIISGKSPKRRAVSTP